MRKVLTALFLCFLLVLPVSAAPTVALTFDDGPSGRFTRALLDGLAERNVKATFFLCGYRIRQYPELAQRIAEEGHEIGCHGFSHDSMATMSRRDIYEEIQSTLALLPEGSRVKLLRPPGGCCSESVAQVAQALKMPIVQWSVDPKDWAVHDAAIVKARVLQQARDGDIILLHDMSSSSVSAALAIVDTLTARGFRFATVSELAVKKQVPMVAGKSYTDFGGGKILPPLRGRGKLDARAIGNSCLLSPITPLFSQGFRPASFPGGEASLPIPSEKNVAMRRKDWYTCKECMT